MVATTFLCFFCHHSVTSWHLSSRRGLFGSYHGELSTTLTVGWHYLFHFKGDHWSPLQHQYFLCFSCHHSVTPRLIRLPSRGAGDAVDWGVAHLMATNGRPYEARQAWCRFTQKAVKVLLWRLLPYQLYDFSTALNMIKSSQNSKFIFKFSWQNHTARFKSHHLSRFQVCNEQYIFTD